MPSNIKGELPDLSDSEVAVQIALLSDGHSAVVSEFHVNEGCFRLLADAKVKGDSQMLVFDGCTFDDVSFEGSHLYAELLFRNCLVRGEFEMSDLVFHRGISIVDCSFLSSFDLLRSRTPTTFQTRGTLFEGMMRVSDFESTGEFRFTNSECKRDTKFVRLLPSARTTFSGSKFAESVLITVDVSNGPTDESTNLRNYLPAVSFYLSEFQGPTEISVIGHNPRGASSTEVGFFRTFSREAVFFSGREVSLGMYQSVISAGSSFASDVTAKPGEHVRLTRVDRTSIADCFFESIDFSDCLLSRGFGLSRARIEGVEGFEKAGRRIVLEEKRAKDDAEEIPRAESVYRELRTALESSGNAPGASDFYYGEMEMRRKGSRLMSPERPMLAAYRWTSGYGTRPLRAFLTLLMFLGVVGAIFSLLSLYKDHPWFGSSVDATALAVNVARPIGGSGMSSTEQLAALATKVVGVSLFAIWVFALRSRVKR